MAEIQALEDRPWAILGATGFVGSGLLRELERRGIRAVSVSAPRLSTSARGVEDLASEALVSSAAGQIAQKLPSGCIVVNAAGLATPSAEESDELFGADSLLPTVVALAAERAGARRYIHLSSAAVQGNAEVLDSNPSTNAFSPYSLAKALGEQVLSTVDLHGLEHVVVRATSVQGVDRPTTRSLQRIAKSPFASVASPSTQPSTVSSLDGLISFVLKTGLDSGRPSKIALQPWEGGTATSVLTIASGGKPPKVLPRLFCKGAIRAGRLASSLIGGRGAGGLRRLELMWFGQAQEGAPGNVPPTNGLIRSLTPPATSAANPRMKVGMLTQWFDPEPGPASLPGIYAREMIRQGHEVSVLTGFPNYPTGQIYDGFKQSIRSRKQAFGLETTRVPLYANHGSSATGRIFNYLSFAASAATFGMGTLRRMDAVWVYNSPVTVSLPLLLQTRFGRKPYFLHVQDLWPDSLLNSGMIPGGLVGRMVERAVSATVRLTETRAAAIGVTSPSVESLILGRNPRVSKSQIIYVPNPSDESSFYDVRALAPERVPDVPWHGKFVFMYVGAMGKAQGLDVWIDVAVRLESQTNVVFVFVGDGNSKADLEARVRQMSLTNVVFTGRIPKEAVLPYMATSSVQIVSLGRADFLRYTTPSKIAAILASRLPIVAQIAGDGAMLVEQSGAGSVGAPGDVAALTKAVRAMSMMSQDELSAAAQAGIDFYGSKLSTRAATDKIIRALQDSTK